VVEMFIYDCAGQTIFNQLDLNTKYVRHNELLPCFNEVTLPWAQCFV